MFDTGHSLNETNETPEPKQKEQFKTGMLPRQEQRPESSNSSNIGEDN